MNIKGMDKDMRCCGFQFEVGKEYKKENNGRPLKLCSDTVFHYCKTLQQVLDFYNCYDKNNRYFEIEVLGEEITDGKKCGSDHIKIVREIVGDELKLMMGLVNNNTGLFNSGDCNSGSFNSGDCNSGYFNSGDCNSGYFNRGDFNSGDFNSGNRNSGVANKCNYSNGVFCNEDDKNIRIFNKASGMSLKDFYESRYWEAIKNAPFELTKWTEYTAEEKAADPQKELVGGYLRTYTMEESWENWWNELSDEDRQIIMEIPNFDPEIFKDITGIEV